MYENFGEDFYRQISDNVELWIADRTEEFSLFTYETKHVTKIFLRSLFSVTQQNKEKHVLMKPLKKECIVLTRIERAKNWQKQSLAIRSEVGRKKGIKREHRSSLVFKTAIVLCCHSIHSPA